MKRRNINPFECAKDTARSDHAVMAMEEPAAYGEVIVVGNYRHIIRESITREEFEEQLAKNLSASLYTCGEAVAEGAKLQAGSYKPSRRPSFTAKYFYRVTVELLPNLHRKG